MSLSLPIRSDALAIMSTATIPSRYDAGSADLAGITGAYAADLTAPDGSTLRVVVKPDGICSGQIEEFAYRVSESTPGLVNVAPTLYRSDAYAALVAFVPGTIRARVDTLRQALRSDVIGMAAFDLIVANNDRHPGNALILPTGHYHHDRIVAIDHGFAFAFGSRPDGRYALGSVYGQRIPHYVHDHAERIAASREALAGHASRLGMPRQIADLVADSALALIGRDRFPERLI